MKYRICIFILIFVLGFKDSFAHHGKGGVVLYQYLGSDSAANTSTYKITVQHYINCDLLGDEPSSIYLGIFDAASNTLIKTVTIGRTSTTKIQKGTFSPCINPQPTVCFYLATYETTITLTNNTGGYILSEQECCRADALLNITNPSSTGFTDYNTIPGVINGVVYRNNSTPLLLIKDTAVVCHNTFFSIDFSATDPDGDSLAYYFCNATTTSSTTRQPNPPSSPPYSSVTYASGFSGSLPMGSGVTINAKTGLISGIAPATTGPYLVAVCIAEFRNGVQISVTKKEVLVTVADCSLTAASLKTSYINCDDYTFTFQNETSSASISSYHWDFGVPYLTTDTSTKANPTYTYPDTGTFTLKLTVTSSGGCVDSAQAPVSVYPGFHPGFTVSGSCYQSPFFFTDTTKATYGTVNSWNWSFGDNGASVVQNPSHQYSATGTYNVSLIVSSSKGCLDTVSKSITVYDKPNLYLPFHDTLICSVDTLPLRSTGTGTFSWTPNYNIINPNSSSPLVYPKDTTTYIVTLTDHSCVATDSVKVNVLQYISVTLPNDTTICMSDSIQLRPTSYALQYLWSPATGLSSTTVKFPMAAPATTTLYKVIANLGKCQASDSMTIKVVPYPQAYAGTDTTICYGGSAQLNGSITGSAFSWLPAGSLSNAGTLYPVAHPLNTTTYVLMVTDTLGCPKPVYDSVVVNVLPRILAFAGNDTSVVANQILQLNATGGVSYAWSPATYLSSTNIANPVVVLGASVDSMIYTVRVFNSYGCYADDTIKIIVFKTGPDIFVPTAFTPNHDGKNDVIKPILVGMKSLAFFKVFNRWGQLVFSTTQVGKGWDGTIGGLPQESNVFVYLAEGTTYLGQQIIRKGTFVLIR